MACISASCTWTKPAVFKKMQGHRASRNGIEKPDENPSDDGGRCAALICHNGTFTTSRSGCARGVLSTQDAAAAPAAECFQHQRGFAWLRGPGPGLAPGPGPARMQSGTGRPAAAGSRAAVVGGSQMSELEG